MSIPALISLIAGMVSVGSLIFGYFKFARSTELSSVSEKVSLWKDRVELLEKDLGAAERTIQGHTQHIAQLRQQLDECRERVTKLLIENRELRKGP